MLRTLADKCRRRWQLQSSLVFSLFVSLHGNEVSLPSHHHRSRKLSCHWRWFSLPLLTPTFVSRMSWVRVHLFDHMIALIDCYRSVILQRASIVYSVFLYMKVSCKFQNVFSLFFSRHFLNLVTLSRLFLRYSSFILVNSPPLSYFLTILNLFFNVSFHCFFLSLSVIYICISFVFPHLFSFFFFSFPSLNFLSPFSFFSFFLLLC